MKFTAFEIRAPYGNHFPRKFFPSNVLPYTISSGESNTVHGERFAGLNCRVFAVFKSIAEVFHEYLFKLHIMVLFKCFKRGALQKFSREKLHWVESTKV